MPNKSPTSRKTSGFGSDGRGLDGLAVGVWLVVELGRVVEGGDGMWLR